MDDLTLHRIPKFSENTESLLSVNRIPVELPGVISAAELEKEYGFTKDDIEKSWEISAYTTQGESSEDSCDQEGVTTDRTKIFSYVPIVRELEESRQWLLEAVNESGLTFGDPTAGITKGPSLPIGSASPYLFTPAFIPAIDIPGVTAPDIGDSGDEDSYKHTFDPEGLSLSVELIEYPTGVDAGESRELCSAIPENSRTMAVRVSCGYNPTIEGVEDPTDPEVLEQVGLPKSSNIKIMIEVEPNKGIMLYSGTEVYGTGAYTLLGDISSGLKGETQASGVFIFTYDVDDTTFSGNVTLTAKATFSCRYKAIDQTTGEESEDYTNFEQFADDTLVLTCDKFKAEDLFDITLNILSAGDRKQTSLNREDCGSESGSDGYRSLIAQCVVELKKEVNINESDWTGSLVVTPGDSNLIIYNPGSDTQLESLSLKINIPVDSSVPAVTELPFDYASKFACSDSTNKATSIKINANLASAEDVSDKITKTSNVSVKCTCINCSDNIDDLISSTLSLYEISTGNSLSRTRRICSQGDEGEGFDAKNFKVSATVSYSDEDNVCGLDFDKSTLYLRITPEKSSVAVKLLPNGRFEEALALSVNIPAKGEQNSVSWDVGYDLIVDSVSKSWNSELKVELVLTAVLTDGSSAVRTLKSETIRLKCSDSETPADCIPGMFAEIFLFEAADDGSMSSKKATTNRKLCLEEGNHRSDFYISPDIIFPEVSNEAECESSVEFTGSLSIYSSGVLIGYYNGTLNKSNITINLSGTRSSLSPVHIAYTTPEEDKTGYITVEMEISGTYTDENGVIRDWSRTADNKKVSIKCGGEDEDSAEDKTVCDILDGLKEGVGISISDCSDGKRTIAIDPSEIVDTAGNTATFNAEKTQIVLPAVGLSCSTLEELLDGGNLIDIESNCDNNPPKVKISTTITNGLGIADIANGSITINAGALYDSTGTTSATVSDGKILLPTSSLSLSNGIGIATISDGKIAVNAGDFYDSTGNNNATISDGKILLPTSSISLTNGVGISAISDGKIAVNAGDFYDSTGTTQAKVSNGKILLPVSSEELTCSDVREKMTAGDYITIGTCNSSSGKFAINVDLSALKEDLDIGVSCTDVRNTLTSGNYTTVGSCNSLGKFAINVDLTALKEDLDIGVSCTAVRNTLTSGNYTTVGSCNSSGQFAININLSSLESKLKTDLKSWVESTVSAWLSNWISNNTQTCG